jgi:hypothetical protein
MPFWAKYNTGTTFEFPMIKRGVVDFAQTGDWTPAAADSAISKDNGNYADTTNTVAIVGGSPTRGVSVWKLTLTATELSAGTVTVQIIDAATKAVEDQAFTVYTYGNASAYFAGDWSDIVRLGLTALPNAAANAAGGLPVSIAGGLDLDEMNTDIEAIQTQTDKFVFTVAGYVDANTLKVGGITQTARDIGASVLLSAGSGAGQLDFTSGVVKANLAQILGTALTETAGQLAAGFKKFFNVASPTSTMNEITLVDTITTYTGNTVQTGDSYARLGAPAGGVSISADIAAVSTAIAALNNLSAAQVKTQMVNALSSDTYAEPGQGTPSATIDLATKVGYLYKAFRNKLDQTSTLFELYNAAGAVVDQKATVSDDATTFTRTAIVTGP